MATTTVEPKLSKAPSNGDMKMDVLETAEKGKIASIERYARLPAWMKPSLCVPITVRWITRNARVPGPT